MSSPFDFFVNGIANATVMNSSRYFEAGTYLLKIDSCTFFHNRKHQPRVAVSCTVEASNNVDFPETSQVSWVVPLDSDSGKEVIKTFICDVSGKNPSMIGPAQVTTVFILPGDASVSEFSGRYAIVNVYEKRTEKGGIFTKCDWKGFNPETDKRPNFQNMPQVGGAKTQIVAESESQGDWGGGNTSANWTAPAGAPGANSGNDIPF